MATGSDDRTVILWDLAEPAHPRRSPDGHTLATASEDHTVILWDLTDPTRAHRLGGPLTGHASGVRSVAFSPDGRTLATGSSDDHTIILWDLTDPAHPRRLGEALTGHTDAVKSVAFSPDGHMLASGSDDKTVILWDLRELDYVRSHALERGCVLTGGGLDPNTWSRHFPNLSYEDPCLRTK